MSEQTPGAHVPGHRSPRERIRWRPLKNTGSSTSGGTIPGHALVYLDVTQGDDFFSQEVDDQQVVLWGKQCDDLGASLQDPALFVVNGPTPIPPGGTGKCTQDWPAQVLHDGNSDRLPNGAACGPKSGSWYVWSTGNAFTCQSHDASLAANRNKIHTTWISPGFANSKPAGATDGAGTVAASGIIPCGGDAFIENTVNIDTSDAGTGLALKSEGLWWVSASATISSLAADGTLLSIRLYLDDTQTYLRGGRTHIITTSGGTITDSGGDTWSDPYFGGDPIYGGENIAFSGAVRVKFGTNAKSAVLTLRNTSGVEIVATDVLMAAFQLGADRPTVTSSDTDQ